MTKNRFFLTILAMVATVLSVFATPNEIVVHTGGAGNGYNQIYVEQPHITYDEDLNELYVYFGTSSTIDIEYLDPNGTPYCYVSGEYHYSGYTATYTNLPAGYYTITIHSVYGYTYTGNFTVL